MNEAFLKGNSVRIQMPHFRYRMQRRRRVAFDILFLAFFLSIGVVWSPVAVWGQTKPQRALGTGHTQAVVAVAFNPDGTSLASASLDRTIILWDTRTAQVRYTFEGRSHVPCAIAFSADGKTLVSCGRNNHQVELLTWSTSNGKRLDERKLSIDAALSAEQPAFSSDGRRLATITTIIGHPYVRVWDVASGDIVAEYETRSETKMANRPPSLSFSPDGKVIATAEAKTSVRLFDITNNHDESFPEKISVCHSAIFSPDGKALAAVVFKSSSLRLNSTSVVILDVAKKEIKQTFPIGAGHTDA